MTDDFSHLLSRGSPARRLSPFPLPRPAGEGEEKGVGAAHPRAFALGHNLPPLPGLVREAAIQRAFEIALRGRTSIVIAHRLSTILRADQILVVNEGRIVERGAHANFWSGAGCVRSCLGSNWRMLGTA